MVVHAGCVQGASEMVQQLGARIPQQEEVNRVTSCMLITSRYNCLLHILTNISHLLENSDSTLKCQTCCENSLQVAERSRYMQ
jgi:hypothetical protein